MKSLWILGLLGAVSLSCGDVEQGAACTPGESVACTGPAACSGFQVCSSDGSAFSACDCSGGSTTSSTASATSGSSTGQGGGMASSSATGTSSSAGGGGTGGDAPFSPENLPGLALWFHTDAGLIFDPQNPGNVLKWDDQSPNGHQAIANASPGWEPTIDPSAVNGYDAVRCFGNLANFSIAEDSSLLFGAGGFLLAGIIRPGPSPSTGFNITRFFAKGDGTALEMTQHATDALRLAVGVDAVTTSFPLTFPATYRIVLARANAMELHVDDAVSSGPTATANVDGAGWPVIFCGGGSTDIAIAEFIAVKGEVSDTVADQVRAYLADKYQL